MVKGSFNSVFGVDTNHIINHPILFIGISTN